MPLKVLIIGAGVCGPAFATLLRRADPDGARFDITIVERAAKLRDTGLQIDLRAQGIPVVRKMGLLDAIRERVVPERGVSFVDDHSQMFAKFGKNDSGHGAQAMTSEYEIMRGDLVDVFYRASLGLGPGRRRSSPSSSPSDADDAAKVKTETSAAGNTIVSGNGVCYEFGTTVTSIERHSSPPPSSSPSSSSSSKKPGGVAVTFSTGRRETYDLVVGADGQSSRTRRFVLGADDAGAGAGAGAAFRPIGLYSAYFLVPRDAAAGDDDGWCRWHAMPGRRAVFTRAADREAPTQVYMAIHTRAASAYGITSDSGLKKESLAAAFADHAGWRVPSFVAALRSGAVTDDDFYAAELGQVRCARLVDADASGRVALLGDAGYCPSPITGMGTTLSLTGAYVLAGELARHCRGENGKEDGKEGDGDGVVAALAAYETTVRPFVAEAQKLPPGVPGIAYPESRWGVWLLTSVIALVSRLRLADLIVRLMPEDKGGLKIPEYPELKLDAA